MPAGGVWAASGAIRHCLQQQMQGLDSHKHLMPSLGLCDASPLLKVRLPVRMLLSGSCITSDAMKPKLPLTSGAQELPSPAAAGAGELQGGSRPVSVSSPEQGSSTGAAAATLGSVFPFDIAANEETRAVWSPGHAPLCTGLGWGKGCEGSATDGNVTCGAESIARVSARSVMPSQQCFSLAGGLAQGSCRCWSPCAWENQSHISRRVLPRGFQRSVVLFPSAGL